MTTIDQNAADAAAGVSCYAEITGLDISLDGSDIICAFIADLMHLCDRDGLNFNGLLKRARTDYATDKKDAKELP